MALTNLPPLLFETQRPPLDSVLSAEKVHVFQDKEKPDTYNYYMRFVVDNRLGGLAFNHDTIWLHARLRVDDKRVSKIKIEFHDYNKSESEFCHEGNQKSSYACMKEAAFEYIVTDTKAVTAEAVIRMVKRAIEKDTNLGTTVQVEHAVLLEAAEAFAQTTVLADGGATGSNTARHYDLVI